MRTGKKEKEYRASFTIEAALLTPILVGGIFLFLLLTFYQYDMVRLQANRIRLCTEQRNQEEVQRGAGAGCILFQVKECTVKQNGFQALFETTLSAQDVIPEKTLSGTWERFPVTEEIRLTGVCLDLVQ